MRSIRLLRSFGPAAYLAFAVAALGCGAGDEQAPRTGDEDNIAETADLLGDDRVGEKLRGHLDRIPGTFPDFEALFGVGRKCAREDSKEIFIVEESSTRAGGTQEETEQLLPRAVVTGCNTDKANPDSAIQSFGLMAALISSPDAPKAADGDPMLMSPVEVMALDTRTGLYNFYVFEDNGPGKPGTLSRIRRMPDDTIVRYRLEPGKRVETIEEPGRACHNCHVHMGPLMNELTEPWSNWVSTHKKLPSAKLSGETKSIVDEAVAAGGEHDRSSFANDLEPVMKAAIRVWVDGLPGVPGSGFGPATIDGDQPDRLEGLLRTAFCETELNFASAFETVPIELFFDPAAIAGRGIAPPGSYPQDVFPFQMPVRSEMDKRIERFLIKQKYLSLRTVTAIRLVDDRWDIFSEKRCSLFDEVAKDLPREPAEVEARVRKVLTERLEAGGLAQGTRAAYMKALLDPATTAEALKAAQTHYLDEVADLYEKEVAKLKTPEGRAELKKRVAARKKAALAMFPGSASPLPVLEVDEEGSGGGGAGGSGAGGGGPGCAHAECSEGEALDPACSECAAAVCDEDPYCCETSFDATCVKVAKGIAACGC